MGTARPTKTRDELQRENADLRLRLEEAQETLRAIREGEVDAVIVSGSGGEQVFSLAGTETIYRLIVETMREAAFTVTFDGTILFCNLQFAEMLGRATERMIGRGLDELVADDQRPAVAALLEAARTGPVRQRLVLRSAGGDAVPAHVATSLLHQGDEPSICAVAADLTELENSSELINRLRQQQQELTAAQESLRQAADELKRSNRDLESFAYMTSHDLQEPLRMVSGFVSLLRDRYGDRLDDKAREYIAFAVEGVERMSTMIRDLLSYSRVDAGQPPGPLRLDDALRAAVAMLRAAIEESGAAVTCDTLPTVMADYAQVRQVLQNLLGNAIKFRAPQRPPRIHVNARPQDGWWVICVADNGIGIRPEHRDRVFELFRRLHPRGAYGGTGIGLAICRRIVERHGGRIWVEPGTTEGSVFCFTLPAAGDER